MVPHGCLVGALVLRSHEFHVLLVRHLDSALFLFLKIEVLLIYSFQVYSKVIHMCVDLYTHIYIYIFFRFFSIICYYKILNIVPCPIQ